MILQLIRPRVVYFSIVERHDDRIITTSKPLLPLREQAKSHEQKRNERYDNEYRSKWKSCSKTQSSNQRVIEKE